MNKKLLIFLAAPVLSLAVYACSGKGPAGGETIPEPYIMGITTDYAGKAVAGKPVTIEGLNFSPVAADNKVVFGVGLDVTAYMVDQASESRIVFTAPEIGKSETKLKVSVKGVESNSVVLQYTANPDPDPEPEEPWDDTPTINLPGAVTKTVCEGVEWTTFHGKWEGQIRNINIIRTRLNEHNKLGIYFNYGTSYPGGYKPELKDGEDPRDLDKKCIYLDAIAGTNGPMACCQFVRVDGVLMHGATDQNPWIMNCALTIDGDVVDIVQVADNYKAARLTNDPGGNYNPPYNTLSVGCAGPLLVWKGKVQTSTEEWRKADTDAWLSSTHPRTAIGLSKDGKTVVQVAVDGRWTQSSSEQRAVGMSTDLLANMMRQLGCYKAMNFDGGGGTAMWVYGYGNSRNIVNRVSENRQDADGKWIWDWDGTRLRPTGNAVYIKSDLKK